MESKVTLFVVPVGPGSREALSPREILFVRAESHDTLRAEVSRELTTRGYRLRALNFGPSGILVYAEEQT